MVAVLAGLYKQLATLKELIQEWREAHTRATGNPATGNAEQQQQEHAVDDSVRSTIFSNIEMCGLTDDIPFYPSESSNMWEVAKRQRHAAAEQAAQAHSSATGQRSQLATPSQQRASPPLRMPGSPKPTRKAAHVMDRYSRAMEVTIARQGQLRLLVPCVT